MRKTALRKTLPLQEGTGIGTLTYSPFIRYADCVWWLRIGIDASPVETM